jgi:pimeloyl-ACP methyl ester carboxylesterase
MRFNRAVFVGEETDTVKWNALGLRPYRLLPGFLAATALLVNSNNPTFAAELQKGSITNPNGSQDAFAVALPDEKTHSGLLVVYLHGAGSDFKEPLLNPVVQSLGTRPVVDDILAVCPGAILLSPNYGGVSWGNDAAVAILDNEIELVAKDYGITRILLIGNSMGASVALSYAATAAPDIKSRITGVIAAQPASDFASLYKTTTQQALRPTLVAAFGGTPDDQKEVYRRKSVAANLAEIPRQCKVVLINAEQDVTVPYTLQLEVARLLESSNLVHKVITRNVGHGYHTNADFVAGLNFINGVQTGL